MPCLSSVPAAARSSDDAVGENGLGDAFERGDVRAGEVILGISVVLRGLSARVVDVPHDLPKAPFGLFETPRVSGGVLLHLERNGGHAAGVSRLGRCEGYAGLGEDSDGVGGARHVGGVHYPTDIAARAVFAATWTLLVASDVGGPALVSRGASDTESTRSGGQHVS